MRKRAALAGIGLFGVLAPAFAADIELALPDYKAEFDNYLISDRLGQEDQVISLFANDVARASARSDGTLPFGSIIVGEIYKAKKGFVVTATEALKISYAGMRLSKRATV